MSYRIEKAVISTEVDGAMVLLHLTTRKYFTLNETGCEIWKRLQSGKSQEQIVSELSEIYDAPLETLERSVARLLAELEQAHLILQ